MEGFEFLEWPDQLRLAEKQPCWNAFEEYMSSKLICEREDQMMHFQDFEHAWRMGVAWASLGENWAAIGVEKKYVTY